MKNRTKGDLSRSDVVDSKYVVRTNSTGPSFDNPRKERETEGKIEVDTSSRDSRGRIYPGTSIDG